MAVEVYKLNFFIVKITMLRLLVFLLEGYFRKVLKLPSSLQIKTTNFDAVYK